MADKLKTAVTAIEKKWEASACVFLPGIPAFALIFFGGVHVWVRSIFSLAIFFVSLAALWLNMYRSTPHRNHAPSAPEGKGTPPCNRPFVLILDPPSLAGVFFILWGLLQVLPLPVHVLHMLSPETAKTWLSLDLLEAPVRGSLSLYPSMTMKTLLLALAFLLFYWLALYSLESGKQVHRVVWWVILLGVLESVYGMFQLASGRNIILWWENPFSEGVLTGTFINRNHLANYMAMTICLAVGYLWSVGQQGGSPRDHRKDRRVFQKLKQHLEMFGPRGYGLVAALILMLAALLNSASRGGLISLVCGFVFMMGLLLARYSRSRAGFVFMAVLSLAVTFVGYAATERIARRLHWFPDAKVRLAMASDGLAMAKAFPLTGSGGGTFEYVYPRFQQIGLDKTVDYVHNDWVQLAAEYGWPGFLVVVAALLTFFPLTIIRWRGRHDPLAVGVGLGGLGAVVAVVIHSLSDFSLHIPANGLLLALILALTWRVVHGRDQRDGAFSYNGPGAICRLKRSWLLCIVLGMTTVLAAASLEVTRIWRADMETPFFRNSTLAGQEPFPLNLRKARSLAPGISAYWLWSAEELVKDSGTKGSLLHAKERALRDPSLHLLEEGLKRNPTDWRIWRTLGWTLFLRDGETGNDHRANLDRAVRAMTVATGLRPADTGLQMEAGNIALYAYRRNTPGVDENAWQSPYRQALARDPALAGRVADALNLNLGPACLPFLKSLLPPEAESYLSAASFLLNRNDAVPGLAFLREGEALRRQKIEGLWSTLKGTPRGTDLSDNLEFRELARLDRNHPGVLLLSGNIMGALKQIDRRGEKIATWGDTRSISHILRSELDENRGNPGLQAYYLARISAEEGQDREAVKWLQASLRHNAQHFPSWLLLRNVLSEQALTGGDMVEVDALTERINTFSMQGIVSDAWKWRGLLRGLPSWSVPMRSGDSVSRVSLQFSAIVDAPWALYLNDRFVEAWSGTPWEGQVALSIPPGEHEFILVTWDRDMADFKKVLPFSLEVKTGF
ncbi:MAG: O-antigen ligase family protein [Syntrophales bacterium]|jgi:O-antigen ligase|nr:O-antigen ligase family protein [Syntrophales bacterium]